MASAHPGGQGDTSGHTNITDTHVERALGRDHHNRANRSGHGPSAKITLWEQYKQLVPNAQQRRLVWNTSKTSDIVLELRRLRSQRSSELSTSSSLASLPSSSSRVPAQSLPTERSSRIVRKRSSSSGDHEAPPNYFALSLPATPINVDSVVNNLVARERSRFGSTEVLEHPNDPVVQRHYFNNVQSHNDILEAVDSVFQQQSRVCKMNVRFGLILEKEGHFQLMDATKAEIAMFQGADTMPTIRDADDLQHHIKDVIDGDALRERFAYPESDSQISGVWQVMVEIFGLDFPMGAGTGFIDDMADDEDEDDEDLALMDDGVNEDSSDLKGLPCGRCVGCRVRGRGTPTTPGRHADAGRRSPQ